MELRKNVGDESPLDTYRHHPEIIWVQIGTWLRCRNLGTSSLDRRGIDRWLFSSLHRPITFSMINISVRVTGTHNFCERTALLRWFQWLRRETPSNNLPGADRLKIEEWKSGVALSNCDKTKKQSDLKSAEARRMDFYDWISKKEQRGRDEQHGMDKQNDIKMEDEAGKEGEAAGMNWVVGKGITRNVAPGGWRRGWAEWTRIGGRNRWFVKSQMRPRVLTSRIQTRTTKSIKSRCSHQDDKSHLISINRHVKDVNSTQDEEPCSGVSNCENHEFWGYGRSLGEWKTRAT